MDKKISVRSVYYGSDAAKTRSLLRTLESLGLIGRIAAQLFRAQKYSTRAKSYRGGIRHASGKRTSFRTIAYGSKETALDNLCSVLARPGHGLVWGWKEDAHQRHAKHVIYIDLPNGQVSFHSPHRLAGPEYPGNWDGDRASEQRIIEFCQNILSPLHSVIGANAKLVCTWDALENSTYEGTVE